MVNVVIADDNIYYATNLMNCINNSNEKIRVVGIADDGKKTLDILNSNNNIDVCLLDLKMPIMNGNEILTKIKDKSKYEKSFIIISGEYCLIKDVKEEELVYKILYKSLTIDDIINSINELIDVKESKRVEKKLRNDIINELLYLGYDISHKGTTYLISSIEYIIKLKGKEVSNLKKEIYPIIASQYKESMHNIKCRIDKETKEMYLSCNIDRLKKYFKYSYDYKPNVKEVINTVINKIS